MKIEVYKCRFTGTIFEKKDKKKYIKHLKELRLEMAAQREYKQIEDNFAKWLDAEKEKITQVDMIVPWILENQRYLMKCCNVLNVHSWSGDKFYPVTDEYTELKMSAKYNPSVSNTHSCPHDGVTNWGGQVPGAPRGYPGWNVQIDGTLKRHKKHMGSYPYSGIFQLIRIHTGSGGGGNEHWSYNGQIYLADWPALGQELTFEKLKGKS